MWQTIKRRVYSLDYIEMHLDYNTILTAVTQFLTIMRTMSVCYSVSVMKLYATVIQVRECLANYTISLVPLITIR